MVSSGPSPPRGAAPRGVRRTQHCVGVSLGIGCASSTCRPAGRYKSKRVCGCSPVHPSNSRSKTGRPAPTFAVRCCDAQRLRADLGLVTAARSPSTVTCHGSSSHKNGNQLLPQVVEMAIEIVECPVFLKASPSCPMASRLGSAAAMSPFSAARETLSSMLASLTRALNGRIRRVVDARRVRGQR